MKKFSYAKPEKLSVPCPLLIKEVVCSTGQLLEINVLVHFPSSAFHKQRSANAYDINVTLC